MSTYTDVVEVMNEVHKSKGGTYGENTAAEIVKLAAEYYNQNKASVKQMSKSQLRGEIRQRYSP